MSLPALILILVGALAHAAWNLVSKRTASGGIAFLAVSALASAVIWAPVAIWSLVDSTAAWESVVLACVVSALLHVGYMLLLQHGYRVADISVVYPTARGSGPLLSVVFAMLLFGDRPGVGALVGVGLIIVGVLFIGLGDMRATNAERTRAGVIFGLLTGVGIATYTIWDAHMVNGADVPPVALMAGCSLGEALAFSGMLLRADSGRGAPRPLIDGHTSLSAGAALSRLRRTLRRALRRFWLSALVFGILSPLSYVAALMAMRIAPVSLVAPAREVSVVFVAIASWLLFAEPHPVRRLGGAAVVLAGVAVLAVW